ncbi:MAG: ABC transporter permease [Actinomycetota bacterium]
MGRYVLRRLIFSIPVLLISSVLVFTATRATTDPSAAIRENPRATAEQVQRYRADLGLDDPPLQQYLHWLGDFVTGDWGTSLISNREIRPEIIDALLNSLVLGGLATVVSLTLGISIGLYSSLHKYSKFDYIATTGAFVGLSMPIFWFALILQLVFGVYLTRWLGLTTPIVYTSGVTSPGTDGFHLVDRLQHLILPVIVLSVQVVAVYSRYMRASMLEVLQSDYLRTARAKGLRERVVVLRHGMRNALIPITTQVALDVGAIAGGLIITETIFDYPGMGSLFIEAQGYGDYPVILSWLMVTVIFVIVFNLIADLLYAVLDPRIRYA